MAERPPADHRTLVLISPSNPFQRYRETLSPLRTQEEKLKWTSKSKNSLEKAVRKRMRGVPRRWGGAPSLVPLPMDFLRFEVTFKLLRLGSEKRQHFGTRLI